jgi:putative DNA primase/helicase
MNAHAKPRKAGKPPSTNGKSHEPPPDNLALVVVPDEESVQAFKVIPDAGRLRIFEDVETSSAGGLGPDAGLYPVVVIPHDAPLDLLSQAFKIAGRLAEAAYLPVPVRQVSFWSADDRLKIPEQFDTWNCFVSWLECQPDAVSPTDRMAAIEISTARHLAVAEVRGLLRNDPGLFRRGSTLVTVVSESDNEISLGNRAKLRGMENAPRTVPVTPTVLSTRLTAFAQFYTWRRTKSGEEVAVDVHPPGWLAQTLIEEPIYPGVRPVLQVAECPFPRPDGSIVTKPGYDAATATLYRPAINFLSVPDQPNWADAKAATLILLGPFKDFPFESDADRAVCLAAILTMIARPAIDGAVPGTAVIGNQAGVGKGLLIDAIGTMATGRVLPTSPYPEDNTEAVKVRLSLALCGVTAVHFDNLEEGSSYGGSAIDSALTTCVAGGRPLGRSEDVNGVPLRPCWFLSGNQVTPFKDAYRRWLPLNLRTQLETPEERDDLEEKNLLAHVAEIRPQLVQAALVILRAHALAGRPAAATSRLGSFEVWDEIVRGAVKWAYEVDPCSTRKAAAAENPERRNRLALLSAWQQLPDGGPDGRGHTIGDVLGKIGNHAIEPGYAQMLEPALLFGWKGQLPSAKSLGKEMSKWKDVTTNGLRLEECGEIRHTKLYRVAGSEIA